MPINMEKSGANFRFAAIGSTTWFKSLMAFAVLALLNNPHCVLGMYDLIYCFIIPGVPIGL